MDKTISCAFTGYRPEKFPFEFDEYSSEYKNFENDLTSAIINAANSGCKVFYSGLARGFDIVAAELVIMLRETGRDIKLHCVMPFKNQFDGWEIKWQLRYLRVVKSADDITVLSDSYFPGCYNNRNKFMIDRSDTVITYFDGQKGGTASTIRMAEKNGLYIMNIAEENAQLTF